MIDFLRQVAINRAKEKAIHQNLELKAEIEKQKKELRYLKDTLNYIGEEVLLLRVDYTWDSTGMKTCNRILYSIEQALQ
jgi:hypothetical protein